MGKNRDNYTLKYLMNKGKVYDDEEIHYDNTLKEFYEYETYDKEQFNVVENS